MRRFEIKEEMTSYKIFRTGPCWRIEFLAILCVTPSVISHTLGMLVACCYIDLSRV